MRPHPANPKAPGETRRQFLKKTGTAATLVGAAGLWPLNLSARETPGVAIVLDPADPLAAETPVRWAAEYLRDAFTARGIASQLHAKLTAVPASAECITISRWAEEPPISLRGKSAVPLPEFADALGLSRSKMDQRPVLNASGSNTRGVVYALLELADRVNLSADPHAELKRIKPGLDHSVFEYSNNPVRSVSRGFNSDVEDLSWFRDREFWTRYLTLLATQRFNRFNLTFGLGYDFTTNITDCYFHFAYPFLLAVPGYDVRAVPLSDRDRDVNLEMLRFISEEAVRRGLQFQLGLWTHAYVWTNSPRANYTIEGLTPETQAPYCRDALRTLLAACPAISGITLRTHGESGVAEGNYGLWKTILDGIAQCGRRVEIDLHAKGIDQALIDVALGTGQPVNVSPKFWAEHMGLPYMQGAIRPAEMPPRNGRDAGFFSRSSGSRSFLRYGYGDLFAENRRYGVLHRLWPGTQRLLTWGDPEMAAAYGRVSGFCGSVGLEFMEPLFFKGRKGSGLPGGRDAYADPRFKPRFDFEKYDYTYRVWGRNLYNPGTDPDGWRRLLRRQFGRGAEAAEGALASASKILPLVTTAHCPSAANNNYWPEMYFNMPMVDANRRHPYNDTPSPKRFGTVSPLDPEFFAGIDEFAGELLSGQFSGKYSPLWVANQLDGAAAQVAAQLRTLSSRTRDRRSGEYLRLSLDGNLQSGLGMFFAAKFRAGVLYALYLRSGYRPALEYALARNQDARMHWTALANWAKGCYREDVTFGPEYFQRGHWLDRLPAIEADVADLEKLLKETEPKLGAAKLDPQAAERAVRVVLGGSPRADRPPLEQFHAPPASFRRGQTLSVVANAPAARRSPVVAGARLRYRRLNQAELWQEIEMEKSGAEYRAAIPAAYTDSPFPLQYHFQIHTASGDVWLHPGFRPGWRGQPYFFVRST